MSHEVEAMFSVNEVPWHKLGTILDSPPTIEDAIRCAGLDWNVALHRLYAKVEGTELTAPAFATVRQTDSSILGVVGPHYKPLQNMDAFKFFQPFVDSKEAFLETAGSLREGKRVWILARLNRDPVEVVPGDAVRKYVLLSNSHDGTLAIRVGFSPIRVVCANTMAMAHQDSGSKLLRIRHTKNANEALDAVRETMVLADTKFEATLNQLRLMTRKGVVLDDLKSLVQQVFKPQVLDGVTETVKEDECERLMGRIIPLFEHGKGNDMPGVKGTVYAAYQGIVEYLQYERGSNDGNRLDSMWFGDSARLNQRAFQVAMRMVA